jgi:hypothetical protein
MSELGPFYPTVSGSSLQANPYSWCVCSGVCVCIWGWGGFVCSFRGGELRARGSSLQANPYSWWVGCVCRGIEWRGKCVIE